MLENLMEKKILIATILTVATATLLTVYWLLEPHRVRVEAEQMRLEAAGKGKILYQEHCARCHGENGAPQRGIRAINSKNYLNEYMEVKKDGKRISLLRVRNETP